MVAIKQFNLKDVSGALTDYNKAIELNPKHTEAYLVRATLKQLNLNDISGALADYNKTIELDPKHAQAYAGRGWLKMEKLKDKTGAIQDFRQAARIFQAQKNTSALQQTIDKLRELGAIE